MKEQKLQVKDTRHPIFNHVPAAYQLAFRKIFRKELNNFETSSSESMGVTLWEERFADFSPVSPKAINHCGEFPAGAGRMWTEWKCLNRLRTGIGRCKVLLHKWGYLKDSQDLNCECGSKLHTMHHLIQCPLLEQVSTTEDCTVQKCVQHWLNSIYCFFDLIRKRRDEQKWKERKESCNNIKFKAVFYEKWKILIECIGKENCNNGLLCN